MFWLSCTILISRGERETYFWSISYPGLFMASAPILCCWGRQWPFRPYQAMLLLFILLSVLPLSSSSLCLSSCRLPFSFCSSICSTSTLPQVTIASFILKPWTIDQVLHCCRGSRSWYVEVIRGSRQGQAVMNQRRFCDGGADALGWQSRIFRVGAWVVEQNIWGGGTWPVSLGHDPPHPACCLPALGPWSTYSSSLFLATFSILCRDA